MPYCGSCGTPYAEGVRFCASCGSAVVTQPPPVWTAPVVPVMQVTPVAVILRPPKSVGAAVLLAFFFGPLGMLYSTVPGALVMFFVSLVLAFPTAGISLFITHPICIIWAAIAAQQYNEGRR